MFSVYHSLKNVHGNANELHKADLVKYKKHNPSKDIDAKGIISNTNPSDEICLIKNIPSTKNK